MLATWAHDVILLAIGTFAFEAGRVFHTPSERGHERGAQRHGLRDGGDATNVTSRLQALTRELDTSIIVSGALVAAIEREVADRALAGLTSRGPTRSAAATRRSTCGRASSHPGPG
jgi:hypothetical protein